MNICIHMCIYCLMCSVVFIEFLCLLCVLFRLCCVYFLVCVMCNFQSLLRSLLCVSVSLGHVSLPVCVICSFHLICHMYNIHMLSCCFLPSSWLNEMHASDAPGWRRLDIAATVLLLATFYFAMFRASQAHRLLTEKHLTYSSASALLGDIDIHNNDIYMAIYHIYIH